MSSDQEVVNREASAMVESFVEQLSDRQALQEQLQKFTQTHVAHHRPIALVTSGGTCVDLDSVRNLENFSTGTRGAISVECLLRKGYAVIHLWRQSSASPYGRLVASECGQKPQEGISCQTVGKLFVGAGDTELDAEDQMVQSVLQQDPWLSDPSTTMNGTSTSSSNNNTKSNTAKKSKTAIRLHRRLEHSSRLQSALEERRVALQEQRLLTVPFVYVEEYLAKLQLICQALKASQSLVLIYLCAAVSDYYWPDKSPHKIDSSTETLKLELSPVPKVMGLLRSTWAPQAYVVSFKLETDATVLQRKAERNIVKYGCHMVIGNLLETRYQQVLIIRPPKDDPALPDTEWPPIQPLQKSSMHPDSLEQQLVDVVVQSHFEYIANSTMEQAGMEALIQAQEAAREAEEQRARDEFWAKAKSIGMEWGGVAAGAGLSYLISTALRRRMGV
mmetsp:Transcript_36595/g.105215  ORF Transcript_36595/g.105215 Transcript_36595/m.105215 type:complete len:446 (-) Transcript_36595:1-1338(-)